MPKIIDDLRETIISRSRALLLRGGYADFTMRSAAAGCGIAVGTLYNYFSSKDELIAFIMLGDWQTALRRMSDECARASSLCEGLDALYGGVMSFSGPYRDIWASYGFSGRETDFVKRHLRLVRSLADCLAPLMRSGLPEQTDIFLAENILICAGSSELTYSSFRSLAGRLFGGAEGNTAEAAINIDGGNI